MMSCCSGLVRPKVTLAFTLMALISTVYYVFILGAHYVKHNHNIIIFRQQEIKERNTEKPKKILFWTGYYNRTNMNFGFGKDPFIRAGCPVTNCWTTADRSELNQSDALIFHAGDFKLKDLPEHRFQHQRYIFYLFETLPRGSSFFRLKVTQNYFNWTMTHRRDSDIYHAEPYGALRRKAGSVVHSWLPPYLPKNGKPSRLTSELTNMAVNRKGKFGNKTGMVAWFCSNRITHGQREDYVKELRKHVQMDVYGKCGNLSCLPRNGHKCNNLLDNYKFYFSAENSLCPDYVTEKFYRALEADVVPIVYGGADYAQYAPPHSYIHVADFGSPKELSDYLHFLAGNEAMYNKYFDWKKEWEVVKRPLNGWCDLCAKLNDPEGSKAIKIYENISNWWYDELPCLPGSSFIEAMVQKKS